MAAGNSFIFCQLLLANCQFLIIHYRFKAMRPFILAETNWKTIKDQKIDLAVLPWGATEAHNYHLPYSTDNILVEKIAVESAQLAWNKGAKVIILPTIPFGVNTGQLDIRLSINMNPSTQFVVLRDVIDLINRQEIYKFMILNGHGGNNFKQIVRELGLIFPKMFICTCNWYQSFENSEYFENNGGHADEMETSIMQYIAPELVLPLNEAGNGKGKKFRINAFNISFTVEADDILIKRESMSSDWEYQSTLSDLKFWKNVIEIEGNENIVSHTGTKIEFVETVSLNFGHFSGRGYPDPKETNGYEIRAKGLFKLYALWAKDPITDFLRDHIDIRYYNTDYFDYNAFQTKMTGLAFYVHNLNELF